MKKIITFLALILFFATVVKAQDLTSKKGIPILPETGEWAIGVDAVPFFYYLGNMLNGNTNNAGPSFDYPQNNPMTLYGKYMVDAKTAYRAKLQITYNSQTDKEFVTKDAAIPDPDVMVEDKAKRNNMDLVLGFGLEKRRGKGRLQGVYGAEALIMFGSQKNTFEYGNSWNPNITPHHVADFGDNYYNGNSYTPITEQKAGSTFGFGVRGFVGVEYFFAPKISLGGEFGWGLNILSTGEGNTTYEYLDNTATPFIDTETINSGGGSAFGFGTDNLSGAINLLFYF